MSFTHYNPYIISFKNCTFKKLIITTKTLKPLKLGVKKTFITRKQTNKFQFTCSSKSNEPCRYQPIVTDNFELHSIISTKNILLTGVLFSNLIVYTIVRNIKDVMLISSCGAEAIPFMKTWINFPVSIGMMFYYSWLINKGVSSTNLYRLTYAPIALVYAFIGIVLYPNRYTLQPDTAVLMGNILHNFKIQIPSIFYSLCDNWITVLFYALSNVWGSVVISLLFWTVANKYTKVEEAKHIYPLFGFIANSALIFAGILMNYVGEFYENSWDLNVKMLMIVSSLFCCISFTFHEILNNKFYIVRDVIKTSKKKIGMLEGLMNSLSNPFIRNMVFMISCYASAISVYETIWKGYMKLYFTNPTEYSKFMGITSSAKGVFTMVMMIISSKTLKHISWTTAALITPGCLSIFGFFFFWNVFYGSNLYSVVVLGASMSAIAKGFKYAFFDPIKEISYIPMSEEIKTKGKATVDVLSSPLGKSGSSLLQQVMIIYFGSLFDASPYFMIVFFVICVTWIKVVLNMNKFLKDV